MKNIEQNRNHWEKLSDRVRAILLGTLYGDSSIGINKGYANARVQFRHSIKQEEYFKWKRDNIRPEISVDKTAHAGNKDTSLQKVTKKNEYGTTKIRYQSKALPSLTYLHKLMIENGKKIVKRSTLNLMTELSIAVWWQDDGSLVSQGRQGVICTDGYTEKEVKIIEQYMRVRWGIETKAYIVREKGEPKLKKDGAERWRLRIATITDLEKLLRMIMEYVEVKIMLKKIIIKYPDAERQQRWTSEIVTRTKFTQTDVEEALAQTGATSSEKAEDDIVHSESESE